MGGYGIIIKNLVMEIDIGLKDLTLSELQQHNGGVLLILAFLLPDLNRIRDFIDGFREGYVRATEI